jgi:hypothetical protein
MSEQAQPVAVDQGNPNPQGIGADGRPVEKKVEVSFVANQPTARKIAKALAVIGETETANRISSMIGEGPVQVSFTERHPAWTGAAITVATAAAGYGIYYGIQRYRNRSKLSVVQGGKVVRMSR